MTLPRRRLLQLAGAAGALSLVPRGAGAQAYPSQPIHFVVGFVAGGGGDIVSRIMGKALAERLGQPVIIDNKPGAATNISLQQVINAPPDGYTMVFIAASAAVNATFMAPLPFDLRRDLVPVAGLIDFPLMLSVNPKVPAKNVAEFIAYAKANPGKLTIGSFGVGSTSHVAGELLKSMTGITMTHVPYRGGAPMMADLVGGQITAAIDVLTGVMPHLQSGDIRVLATAGAKRIEAFPDIPTLSETVPLYVANSWCGIGVPKGTSPAIVERLNREVNASLADPAVKKQLANVGTTPMPMSPAEFGKYVANEIDKWGKVIKASGVKPG